MLVEIEKGRLCDKLLDSSTKIIDEYKNQINIVTEQKKECEAKVDTYGKVIEAKDLIIQTQTEDCKKLVDTAKGTFWSRLKSNLGVFGVGSLTGILVVGLLVLLI